MDFLMNGSNKGNQLGILTIQFLYITFDSYIWGFTGGARGKVPT